MRARPSKLGISTRSNGFVAGKYAPTAEFVEMVLPPYGPLTMAEFVDWELRQQAKHEFAGGHVFGFAGGTLGHAALASALNARVRGHVSLPCKTLTSNALIEMEHSARYADLVVTCDARDDNDMTSVRYPKLIIEVLSKSTASVDRGEKLDEYRSIPTLEEYSLIDSSKPWAETYRRIGCDWIASLPITTGDLILTSIGLTIDLDQIYFECGIG